MVSHRGVKQVSQLIKHGGEGIWLVVDLFSVRKKEFIFARHADRVRMANIAQMINVLQAMIMTDKDKMVLTPTYHVFKMYVPFQDATFVPVTFNAGTYRHGDITLPRVDAIAAKDAAGKLWLEITNVDPSQAVEIEANLSGITAKSAAAETLTAPKVTASTPSGHRIQSCRRPFRQRSTWQADS